jgi:RimJ/RimL family protein N-acetyltransferase
MQFQIFVNEHAVRLVQKRIIKNYVDKFDHKTDEDLQKFISQMTRSDVNDELTIKHRMLIYTWMGEQAEGRAVRVCVLNDKNDKDTIYSFALLSQCDYDPFEQLNTLWTMNFIYTFPQFRNQQKASKLLQKVQGYFNLMAFVDVDNVESTHLMKKNGFVCKKIELDHQVFQCKIKGKESQYEFQ